MIHYWYLRIVFLFYINWSRFFFDRITTEGSESTNAKDVFIYAYFVHKISVIAFSEFFESIIIN